MSDRNIVVLHKIIRYAEEIRLTIQRLDVTRETFGEDYVAKNAISMCLLQIGELVSALTTEFRQEYSQIPWRDVVALRNRAAHAYSSIDIEVLWDIATDDIPNLKTYCESAIKKLSQD